MEKHNFIGRCIEELVESKISVLIHAKQRIKKCGGWFDTEKNQFVVAYKNHMAFEIFIHEYCHFLQWKENPDQFKGWCEATTIMFDWLDGTDYSDEVLDKAIKDSIHLEWDCENRAFAIIEEFKLNVNVSTYKKATNAYLLFYQSIRLKRKWADKKSPYAKSMLKYFSDEFHGLEYYQNPAVLTDELKLIFDKVH